MFMYMYMCTIQCKVTMADMYLYMFVKEGVVFMQHKGYVLLQSANLYHGRLCLLFQVCILCASKACKWTKHI